MSRKWNEEPQNLAASECLKYFREQPVFDRLLRGFREKYSSYGGFAGKVVLRNLTGQDIESLEGFFRKNYHGRKSATISAEQFAKALCDSRFGSLQPKELLELYFGEEMTGKKERQLEEERQWREIFACLKEEYAKTAAEEWIREMAEEVTGNRARSSICQYLLGRYREAGKNMAEVHRILCLGAQILNHIPYRKETREYLAVFAAMLTGNPHAFDEGTKDGQLLYLLVQREASRLGFDSVKEEKEGRTAVFPVIRKQQMYLRAGILRDDMSNYAMVSGIRAWKKDGTIHAGMEGFAQEGDMVQVPLAVIASWGRVECPDDIIYIVENPSVYAMLCRTWKGSRACMCMYGQPRLSSVLLLDLLADAGVKVYYAGDFDPEGLLIAQKLRQYYRGDFVYWQMSAAVYEQSCPTEKIPEKRLGMLDRITDPELAETAEAVRKTGAAGYQEKGWERYL